MCNACGFHCCADDRLSGCGCECECLGCRLVECEICGKEYDIWNGHECEPCCPYCGKRTLKVKDSLDHGYYVIYVCKHCGKEVGEDELPLEDE